MYCSEASCSSVLSSESAMTIFFKEAYVICRPCFVRIGKNYARGFDWNKYMLFAGLGSSVLGKLCPRFWLSTAVLRIKVQFFPMRTNQGLQMTSLFIYLFFTLRCCFKSIFCVEFYFNPFSSNFAYAWVSSTKSDTVCRICRTQGPVMQTIFFFNLFSNIVALQLRVLPLLWPTCLAAKHSVASWGNMLRKVDSSFIICNKF